MIDRSSCDQGCVYPKRALIYNLVSHHFFDILFPYYSLSHTANALGMLDGLIDLLN